MNELKIVPVERGGFIIKIFGKDSDLRSPIETLVAGDLATLITLIGVLYTEVPIKGKKV